VAGSLNWGDEVDGIRPDPWDMPGRRRRYKSESVSLNDLTGGLQIARTD
jgi:drug/metabolite transporter superfamily protein YnfA